MADDSTRTSETSNAPPPYPQATPPAVLYHAVTATRLEQAIATGLRPTGRPHVHLSFRPEHARNAVKSEDTPVLLRIDTAAMDTAGVAFFVSPKGTWLVESVPANAIRLEDAMQSPDG